MPPPTRAAVAAMIPEEKQKIRDLLGAAYGAGKYDDAAQIFADLAEVARHLTETHA